MFDQRARFIIRIQSQNSLQILKYHFNADFLSGNRLDIDNSKIKLSEVWANLILMKN